MRRRTNAAFALALTAQGLALTVAYAAVIVHAASGLENYVAPHIDSAWIFAAAFTFAALLGLTARSPRVLAALVAGMCVGGAALYGALLYAPVWRGIALATVDLQNYAMQQALLVLLWSVIPAAVGALAGAMGAPALRRDDDADPFADDARRPWWVERDGR